MRWMGGEAMNKFQSDVAHIVYASDDKFAEVLGVSMTSLYENCTDMRIIIVYILDSGVSECNKQRIESICNSYHQNLPVWIPARNISKELSIEVAVDRGSLSQYARLFISSVMPKDLLRVLYLDCDIIVNKSIYELWNLDMCGKTIAALMDAFSSKYRANIGLEPSDVMFNSGVMLIDLEKWKEQKIEKKILDYIVVHNGRIQQGDQGALNAILSNHTYCFEPKFNTVTIFYDFTYSEMMVYRKPPKFYTEQQIKQATEDPFIIHFTTSFMSLRPWIKGCQHQYAGKWLKYKFMGPWKDSPLWEDNSPRWKRVFLLFYKRCPKKMALQLAGLLQAYGRPLKNRLRRGKKCKLVS